MYTFVIRFIICNLFLSIIIGLIFAVRKICDRQLSSRMKYQLWFVFLALLFVPFLQIELPDFMQLYMYLPHFHSGSAAVANSFAQSVTNTPSFNSDTWMNDFTNSASTRIPSIITVLLCALWITGVIIMLILVFRSMLRLLCLKRSSLPIQNQKVKELFLKCQAEMAITKEIPVYSTVYLNSPVIVGLIFPRIYLPIHLISDFNTQEMRFILLHELQHFKHKDALANYVMNLARTVYWFNPFVWIALKAMQNDREIACDTAVLEMLDHADYTDYGNTLINYIEKISLSPFPFSSGIGSGLKQMKKRIINIASYEAPSRTGKIKSMIAFLLTILLLFSFVPVLSTYAANKDLYKWNAKKEAITNVDLSSYFEGYDGCFVLYDQNQDSWDVYNQSNAVKRTSPDSSFKIYEALFGLERDVITPASSQMSWNHQNYPIESWNTDQNLYSAMQSSVNWYFEAINAQLGLKATREYINKINYGNCDLSGGINSYWKESSLKISAVEQINLLRDFYYNNFSFDQDNIDAVKESIRLSTSAYGKLYGKTGSGRVSEKDVNGWFIGYVESNGNTYFYATNIQPGSNSASAATGGSASEITLSILSDLNIWR